MLLGWDVLRFDFCGWVLGLGWGEGLCVGVLCLDDWSRVWTGLVICGLFLWFSLGGGLVWLGFGCSCFGVCFLFWVRLC